MVERQVPDVLLSFPCLHEFKAFGPAADETFQESVFHAVNQIVAVSRDSLRTRSSSSGQYQCITVSVHLENSAQLTGIYDILRGIEGLRYLL
jgi:putative lipoic acid-binding regulatory protein